MNTREPVDLLRHIRLAQNSLLGCLDPTRRHVPYWNCGYEKGDVSGFSRPSAWDRCHDVARAIHALSMVEPITRDPIPPAVMDDLSAELCSLFDGSDDLPGTVSDQTGKRFVHLHNIRETTHALAAMIRRGDTRAEPLGRRMMRAVLQAMDEDGTLRMERLPGSVEPYDWQPSQEGRAVDALVRYYRVSEDDAALELALRMTRYALDRCFTPEGAITEEAGTHGHSINALVAGVLDLALLVNDPAMLGRAKAVFDVGLPRFNSSFGWSMENLREYRADAYSPQKLAKAEGLICRGESNNTGDLLRAALLLGKAGYPEYYGRAERILRGHLLPSQVVDVDGMSDDAGAAEDRLRSLASRIRGGFSFPTPNELMYDEAGPIVTYDITSGAADALCEVWRAIAGQDSAGIRVNLLLDVEADDIRVESLLPREGRVEISNRSSRNVFVRVPWWVSRCDVSLSADGALQPVRYTGGYLRASGKDIAVRFPVREERTVESIAYKRYTIDWRGDQIMAMSPAGRFLPMFPLS